MGRTGVQNSLEDVFDFPFMNRRGEQAYDAHRLLFDYEGTEGTGKNPERWWKLEAECRQSLC